MNEFKTNSMYQESLVNSLLPKEENVKAFRKIKRKTGKNEMRIAMLEKQVNFLFELLFKLLDKNLYSNYEYDPLNAYEYCISDEIWLKDRLKKKKNKNKRNKGYEKY